VRRELLVQLGRKPTQAEVAAALDLTEEKLDQILEAGRQSLSLHVRVGKDEDTELLELIEADGELAPDDLMDFKLLSAQMQEVLDQLSPRERDIIQLRFGLQNGHNHTLSEIGQLYGLSRERVRQIQAKAMRKLRHPRRQALLKDWAVSP
jgi:RNA polymerase primary sigma factor